MSKTKTRRTGQLIEREEGVNLVRVFLGRDPKSSKRNYLNKTIKGTKRDAQRFLNGVLREIDLGTFVEPSAITLNEYLDKWLETAAKPRLSERTFADYSEMLNRYVRSVLGGRKISDIRALTAVFTCVFRARRNQRV
jgi:integrase